MRRVWACLVALALPLLLAVWPTVRVLADTTVFSDTFTGSTVDLPMHTPTTAGVSWSLDHDGTGATTTFRNNTSGFVDSTATRSGTVLDDSNINYLATGNSTFVDGYVQATMTQINDNSADDFFYLRIRRTAADTYLGCGWYASAANPDTRCFKVVSGTYTELTSGNGNCDFVDNSVIRVTVSGDNLTITKDGGAACVSATGANAISTAGDTGFGMGNLRNATDDTTAGVPTMDNYSAVSQDAAPSGPPVGSLGLLGVGK